MSDSWSMSEFTGCDSHGHSWENTRALVLECIHCGDEREGPAVFELTRVIPIADWPSHPWLSTLERGDDREKGAAWFWTSQSAPGPRAALETVTLQVRFGSDDWRTLQVTGVDHTVRFEDEHLGDLQSPDDIHALVRRMWDFSSIAPDAQSPTVPYFSDWRTRTWMCPCGWTRDNTTALVSASESDVSIACPASGHGIALITRRYSDAELHEAAHAGMPEAVALAHPDEYGSPLEDGRGKRQFVTGSEQSVPFSEGDQFFGVSAEWLLPRLRLNKDNGPVDLFERWGLCVVIDNELHEDIDPESFALGEGGGELCSYNDGGVVGGRYDIVGEWIVDCAPELRHSLEPIPPDADLRQLALVKLGEGISGWEPAEYDLFEASSPYLDAARDEDVKEVLNIAGDAGEVVLNDVIIRSRLGGDA